MPVYIWYDAPGYVAILVFAVHEMQPDWLTESPTYRPEQPATNQKRQNTERLIATIFGGLVCSH